MLDLIEGFQSWAVELIAPAWGFGSVMLRAISSSVLALVLFIFVARYQDVSFPGVNLGKPSVETLHLLYSTEFVGSVFIAGLLVNYALQHRRERLQDLEKAIEKALGFLYERMAPQTLIERTKDEKRDVVSRYKSALSDLRRWPTGRQAWKAFQAIHNESGYLDERGALSDELRSALGEVSYLGQGSLSPGLSLRFAWGQLMVVWVFLLCATAWSSVVAGNLPMIVSMLLTIFALNVCIRLIDGQI